MSILVTFLIKWKGESFLGISVAQNEKKIEWPNKFGKFTVAPSWMFSVHISILQFLKFCGKTYLFVQLTVSPSLWVLISWGYRNTLPQTEKLKREINHSLTILEAKSLKIKVSAGPCSLWRLSGRILSYLFLVSGVCWQSLACGNITPIFLHSHMPSSVCMCYVPRFLFLERHPVIGLTATLTLSWLDYICKYPIFTTGPRWIWYIGDTLTQDIWKEEYGNHIYLCTF